MSTKSTGLGKVLEHPALQNLVGASLPEAVFQGDKRLIETNREEGQEHHHGDACIQTPEDRFHHLWGPILLGYQVLDAVEHARQCHISFDAKHGGMGMATGDVRRMLVVVDDGKVDKGAKDASTKDVPEVDADEEEPHLLHDEFLVALLLLTLCALVLLHHGPSVQREEDEGQDLRGGEGASEGDDARGIRDPVEVVADADCGGEEKSMTAMYVARSACLRETSPISV